MRIAQLITHWRQEAMQLRLSRQLQLAKGKYECLVSFEAEQPDLWHNLALINYELFCFQEALQGIDKAIILDNHNFLYYYNAGLIL